MMKALVFGLVLVNFFLPTGLVLANNQSTQNLNKEAMIESCERGVRDRFEYSENDIYGETSANSILSLSVPGILTKSPYKYNNNFYFNGVSHVMMKKNINSKVVAVKFDCVFKEDGSLLNIEVLNVN